MYFPRCWRARGFGGSGAKAIAIAAALGALASCGANARSGPSATAANADLTLDVPELWIDPEADLIVPRTAEARKRAVENPAATRIVIRGATVLTATGVRFAPGLVALDGGAIAFVGAEDAMSASERAAALEGATVIDGTGRFVTPGIIDAHSHLGVYAAPNVIATDDGNEVTAPVTAQVRAASAYQPQDPAISRAIAGGVTAALILPGSANLIGGEGFTVVMRPGRTADESAFPDAPRTLKMACGENPKRVYGDKGGPGTRMGVYAQFRAAFEEAAAYEVARRGYARSRASWQTRRARAVELDAAAVAAGKTARVKPETAPVPPPRNAKLETLAAVLRGEVLVQTHCYKATDMGEMIAIADQFGFAIRSFHHALEAYKIRDLLVARGIAINTWADWWGFKMEAFDGIRENAALFHESGGRTTIHSDSSQGIQRLNQEAAKALAAGQAAGVAIGEDDAVKWITANPAWVLGIDDVTGTLEAGKRADVVLWSGDPFSVYSKADLVIGGGEVTYDRSKGLVPSDFELGNSAIDADATVAPATATGGAP